MLVVALLSYLCSNEINACQKRIYNNFFSSLFHDLPEVLTRDIISPVKRSVEGIEEIILEYERIALDQKILPLLPRSWHSEMNYFLQNQFENRIINNGIPQTKLSSKDIQDTYNSDEYSPVDGELIKACDIFSAFTEAALSIRHGVKSHHLINGVRTSYDLYKSKTISGIPFGQLFDYFNIE
jgi:putative hydrolase of HD superfamily